jgi:hypothetical protein
VVSRTDAPPVDRGSADGAGAGCRVCRRRAAVEEAVVPLSGDSHAGVTFMGHWFGFINFTSQAFVYTHFLDLFPTSQVLLL